MGKTRTIENEYLIIEVNDHGAELSRIFDKKKCREVLWNGDPAYWNRHAPVLFPFVGALEGNSYTFQGKSYPMSQHGFARDSEFTLQSIASDQIIHKLESTPETLKVYPFAFSLTITHSLEGSSVKVGWEVRNCQQEPLYFSIGAHPAFLVPADGCDSPGDYYLKLSGSKAEYPCIRICPEGTALPQDIQQFPAPGGFHPLEPDLFKDGVWIFEDGQLDSVGLCYPDQTPYVTIDCQGFPYVGIWSKPGAPFVCLEPWYGRTDDQGFSKDFTQKKGIQKLGPQEIFYTGYTMTIS